ncbi:MAG: hypothetical protein HC769_22440 [Cyanobacteria bacterium CRU_2_1]|nr:hypothetical protein [Cyanobacteria bacterium CRU_2_1]
MLNDWHIGSGTGRPGDVDRLIQRDADGLPYIPAKTLTGIWRDACEQVAFGLDEGIAGGQWSQWVIHLFGNQPPLEKPPILEPPRPAALSIRSAHLSKPLQNALLSSPSKPLLKEAITFIKPGIQINAQTGCAEPNFLRFEELVRGGTTLETKCQLQLLGDATQKEAAYALLMAGTKLVERLGGKRRRGAGQCQLVVGRDLDAWISWLEQHSKAPPIPNWSDDPGDPTLALPELTHQWQRIQLAIKTVSPLIVPCRTVGNVVETLDYIPGTQLLGLILKKLRQKNLHLDAAIAQGQIIVTNATLQINEHSSRPVPLALFSDKLGGGLEKGGKVYNRLAETEHDDGQMKGERAGYLSTEGASLLYGKVEKTVETHNIISDDEQRPTEQSGGVYSYETIAPGTCLQAELRLPTWIVQQLNQQHRNWWTLLQGSAQLGQSKKDDYGLVKITVSAPEVYNPTVESQKNHLTVWLLSDLLLRDDRLRPTASIAALKQELEKHLNVTLTVRKRPESLLHFLVRQRRSDSWQVRWQLPRPSLAGLSAGSCIVFEVQLGKKGEIDQEILSRLEIQGIGERRAEGYGQLCFNSLLLAEKTPSCLNSEHRSAVQSEVKAEKPKLLDANKDYPYARIIERAAWREAIRRSALQIAGDPQRRSGLFQWQPDRPTMNQLGALRSTLRSIDDVMSWLAHLGNTDNRREKWTDESLQAIRRLVTPEESLAKGNAIWQELALPVTELCITRNAESELKKELWAEAVTTLIDACIRAHKRSLESRDSSNPTEEEIIHGASN